MPVLTVLCVDAVKIQLVELQLVHTQSEREREKRSGVRVLEMMVRGPGREGLENLRWERGWST